MSIKTSIVTLVGDHIRQNDEKPDRLELRFRSSYHLAAPRLRISESKELWQLIDSRAALDLKFPKRICCSTDGNFKFAALAAMAVGTRIRLASFLHRPARLADACFADNRRDQLQLFQENGPGKIKTLRVANPGGRLQVRQFLKRLDAFRDHGHAQRLGERFDRPQNSLAARAKMDIADEGTIDL